jgi:hypothetical protein
MNMTTPQADRCMLTHLSNVERGDMGALLQGLAAAGTETEVSPEVHDETKKKKEREQK